MANMMRAPNHTVPYRPATPPQVLDLRDNYRSSARIVATAGEMGAGSATAALLSAADANAAATAAVAALLLQLLSVRQSALCGYSPSIPAANQPTTQSPPNRDSTRDCRQRRLAACRAAPAPACGSSH